MRGRIPRLVAVVSESRRPFRSPDRSRGGVRRGDPAAVLATTFRSCPDRRPRSARGRSTARRAASGRCRAPDRSRAALAVQPAGVLSIVSARRSGCAPAQGHPAARCMRRRTCARRGRGHGRGRMAYSLAPRSGERGGFHGWSWLRPRCRRRGSALRSSRESASSRRPIDSRRAYRSARGHGGGRHRGGGRRPRR